MVHCNTCNQDLAVDAFERVKNKGKLGGYRRVCKKCRQAKRKATSDATPKDPNVVPKPERCANPECKKPTEKEGAKFTFRNDIKNGAWKSICKVCFVAKGYSQTCRARKRAADPKKYLADNAKQQAKRRLEHPEDAQKQQMLRQTVPEHKFKALMSYAKTKGIEVTMDDADALQAKLSDPCHYCLYTPKEGGVLNGLDRVNPKGLYDDDNTVACCATCNAIKASHTVDSFVHHARKIHDFRCRDVAIDNGPDRVLPAAFGGTADRRQATKTKTNHLSRTQKIDLWVSPCYLCGREPALGIDRMDSCKDYTMDNVKPCCSTCNYFKKDLTEDEIKKHVAHINAHTATWVLGKEKFINNLGKDQVPVAAYDSQGTMKMMFPSVSKAAKFIKAGVDTINKVRDVKGAFFRGCIWRTVTDEEFFTARFDAPSVRAFLESVL